MGRKAKHHYIPKCYLKEFTDGGKDSSPFWCIPINNDSPFETSPNNACAQRDYYTVQHSNPLIVEDWYAEEIEPKIRSTISHIKKHSSLPPEEEMHNLILLLAMLYLRAPSFRESLESPMKKTRQIVESMSKYSNIINTDEFNYNQTDLIKSELKLIETVQNCLSRKYYQLHIIDNQKSQVITSDRPFLLNHPNGRRGFYFGLNTPNIEICIPITKNAIIIARNEKIKEGAFMATDKLIGLTNTKLIITANRFFYSSNTNIILVDDNMSVYKYNFLNSNDIDG